MIISVHLPKTAGSSFASSLMQCFGKKLLKDYADLPLHHTSLNRNKHALIESGRNYFRDFGEIECIHGHFLPLKYRFHKSNNTFKYVTWMREPAERLASQYYYMKRHYTPEKAANQPLLERMIDEDWTLERFCLGPELKNTYSQFLWGFPIKKFDFIGIVEHYETELDFFSDTLLKNSAITHYQQNVNSAIQKSSYFAGNEADEDLKNKVVSYHAKDFILYNNALKLAQAQGRL
jgi:hypothetical protein